MAVMENEETVSKTGFKKRIDEESESVILNIVQVALYQYPFKSMVREVVSNAIDAVKEKETARLIKTGAAKVSDYYVEMEGDLYKNSRFNPDYYDLAWLSKDNTVFIDYHVNKEISGRDLLSIKDTGVGLGGSRLEKFFMPGASSKRLNKQALGKYGIGNKSPLSTGVESYRLISCYNGHKYIFDIRENKIDSVVPKFNEKGEENPSVELTETTDMRGNAMRVYYEPTKDKNSVEIQVEIKKHNKSQVFEAVRSQLMYFKEDIIFTEHNEYDNVQEIAFKTPILYEDEDIILPVNTSFFNKPHFVLNNVCYGLINFQEMELNPRFGCIGMKMDISKIDVNPSRESVAYTQKTTQAVLDQYAKIVSKVEKLIEKELTTKDTQTWLKAVNTITSNSSNSGNQILTRLSNLIDKTQLQLTFEHDIQNWKYSQLPSNIFGSKVDIDVYGIEGWGDNRKIKKTNIDSLTSIDYEAFYYKDAVGNPTKNAYLCSRSSRFFTYSISTTVSNKELVNNFLEGKIKEEDFIKDLRVILTKDGSKKDTIDKEIEAYVKSCKSILMLNSSVHFKSYDAVIVPETYENNLKTSSIPTELTPAEKAEARKNAGNILIGKLESRGGSNTVFASKEIPLTSLPENIVYGHTSEQKQLSHLGSFLYSAKKGKNAWLGNGDDMSTYSDIAVIKIAKNLKKHVKDQTFIDDWGFYVEDGIFKIEPVLMATAYRYYINKRIKQAGINVLQVSIHNMCIVAAVLKSKDNKYSELMQKLFQNKPTNYFGADDPEYDTSAINLIRSAIDYQNELFSLEEDLSEDDNLLLLEKHMGEFVDVIDGVECFDREDLKTIDELIELTHVYFVHFENLLNNPRLEETTWTLDGVSNIAIKEYLNMVLEYKRYQLINDYPNLF